MVASSIKLTLTPMEYFHERITDAGSRLGITLPSQTEFYLVNMLCEFIDPARLNATVGEMSVLHQPLTMIYKEALEAPPNARVKYLKRLGDVSLYVAGFFQDYFNRRAYDIDYFMGMGRSAYMGVSGIMRDRHGDADFSALYASLASEFHRMVDLVATVADAQEGRNRDITSLLLRQSIAPSERIRQLIELDEVAAPRILPNAS